MPYCHCLSTTLCRTTLTRAALVAVACLSTVSPVASQPPAVNDSRPAMDDIPALKQALEPFHARYDETARMLRRPFSSPGYHTTLTGGDVHPTRESLEYAVALLDTGDAELAARAEDILDAVIGLQDQAPASKTYGIWPWFLEEPLAKMSPPDWNWADFCGVQLLQVARAHRDRLPAALATRVDASIQHAVASIRKRDVGPGYTNIALMGTYVTLVASELYADADLHQYAMNRLRAFHAHTLKAGGFTEYNSPTYTIVSLRELARLSAHVRDPEAKPMLAALYHRAWEEIATRFHAPSRQWSGPHSRCYHTLLSRGTLEMLDRSTGTGISPDDAAPTPPHKIPSPSEIRLPTPCPPDLRHYFSKLDRPREQVNIFIPGAHPVIGTTWLTPDFSLGSLNRGDFWNQRRPLVAYWNDNGKPSYLAVRFLNNDYDFAAARFYGVQKQGTVLGAVAFATNGGNRHVSLDRLQNARFRTSDLRLRFEFGGAAARHVLTPPAAPNAVTSLALGTMNIKLHVPFARFGASAGRWEATRGADNRTTALDVVLYHGAEKEIHLDALATAALGVAVSMSIGEPQGGATVASLDEKLMKLNWEDAGLSLAMPVKPDTVKALDSGFLAGPMDR